MLTLRELQELRQVNDDRKALTDRYGVGFNNPLSARNEYQGKQTLGAWDPITNKPQTLIVNNGSDPIVLDHNTPRQEITKNIVFQKGFPFQTNQPQIRNPQAQTQNIPTTYSKVQSVQHIPQNYMHENHHRQRPYQLKSVEEILRPWKAKEIMYNRELKALQDKLNKGNYSMTDKRTLKVDNVAKKLELQNEVEKLEAILKNKDEEITRLKIRSQEIEEKLIEISEESSTEFNKYQKELEEWKKKFKELNNLYHECEEECTMKETEIESLKKRKLSVIKTQTVQKVGTKPQKNMDSPRAIISTVSDKDSDYY
ncbi:unnamed protein product (macronuclear) [Paramecium tetraurelia]|uniref:Enkurin domain-containing protein n=1 Tax=Paramecium tetraurelia TaxID=5888 RepID=A0BIG8_PARTE|nr:uncharacterized protein GSPATT00004707001 [Paramecium tetraurelia]CAK58335.1 unnamed protein product [Paramecium tetraurelia]|eukprot:XP_001425733.1 hypothetical protein (macronuclear) [Paramecium tetraurelia strain d4-2]